MVDGCNPYLTKRIDIISKNDQREAIYVAYPIIECRRQARDDFFYKDPDKEINRSAETFTKKALHELLDKRLPVRFAELDTLEYSKSKKIVDSVLGKFLTTEVEYFRISQELNFKTERNLILIPYLVWTRGTDDYHGDKCSYVGHNAFRGNSACLWTQSQTLLLMINRKSKEVVYFKYSQCNMGLIYSPYEVRVRLNFKHCAQPLLRKLGYN